jgi:hypothetical protein
MNLQDMTFHADLEIRRQEITIMTQLQLFFSGTNFLTKINVDLHLPLLYQDVRFIVQKAAI